MPISPAPNPVGGTADACGGVSTANGRVAPLVPLIAAEQAPLLARRFFADGDPGPIVAALAQVPELLEVTAPFLGTVLGPSCIATRTKEIIILRTSARASCRYCVDAHTVVALDAGLSVTEVRALRGELDAAKVFVDPADRAAVGWCDALVATGPVSPEAKSQLRGRFADHEVVELTLLATTTLLLNRFCTSLDLPTSPGVRARLATEGLG
ncbi:MAG: carboxymuconolactone decarboxylase family protein [Acidimicrobiales bacterium]